MSAPTSIDSGAPRRSDDSPSQRVRPPRLASELLSRLLYAADREYILGDLEEAYSGRVSGSHLRAAIWYWSQIPINLGASMLRRATAARRDRADRQAARTTGHGAAGRGPTPGSHNRGDGLVASMLRDARYALRGFVRAPGFTVVAVLTMALGIGANAAVFSVLHAVVLAPLPYPDSQGIVRVWPEYSVARGTMLAFEERASSFAAVSAFAGYDLTLVEDGRATILDGTRVSPKHFEVMGVLPALGRSFLAAERIPGSDGVIILSHALWRDSFGADPGIVGKSVSLQGGGFVSRTVVGVMPQGFRPVIGSDRQFWIPLVVDASDPETLYGKFVRLIARMNPGVTSAQAQAESAALAQALRSEDPDLVAEEEVTAARVATLQEETVGDVRHTLLILSAAAAFVLLVACCNLVNLLLARAGARRDDIAIQRALGAGRWRVMRQVLTESAVLGLAGGVAGLLAAVGLDVLLGGLVPAGTPRAEEVSIDGMVGGIVLVAAVSAGLLAGVLPAWHATRPRPSSLQGGTRVSSERGGRRLSSAVIVAEIALSVVLVTGASLMLKSVWKLQQVDPGFEVSGVASMLLSPPDVSYPDGPRQAAYYESVIERVEALPGVDRAAMIHLNLMTFDNWSAGFLVEGRPRREGEPLPSANARSVTPGYFETMRIPLVAGRVFDDGDHEEGVPVVVINETMASEVWPGETALGQRIRLYQDRPPSTVVGIVGDVRQHALDQQAAAEIYRTYRQWPVGSMYLMVRARGEPANILPVVQDAVWSIDDGVPIAEVAFVQDAVLSSVSGFRFLALLLSGFAALALVLGCVGVYGVMSYAIGRRFHEFGVRMALGAAPGGIVKAAVLQGARVAFVGIVLGVAGARASSRLLEASLYEVSADDVATFSVVAVFLAVVAVLANYLPARRAGKIDVVDALRRG